MLFNSPASKYIFVRILTKPKKTLFSSIWLKSEFLSSSSYINITRVTTKRDLLKESKSPCNLFVFHERGQCSQSSAELKDAFNDPRRKRQKFSTLPASLVKVEDPNDKDYQNNLAKSRQLIAQYEAIRQVSLAGGGPRSIERHVKFHRKLLARDRLKLVLDEDTSFLELSQIAGMGMEYGNVPQAGMLAGNLLSFIFDFFFKLQNCFVCLILPLRKKVSSRMSWHKYWRHKIQPSHWFGCRRATHVVCLDWLVLTVF